MASVKGGRGCPLEQERTCEDSPGEQKRQTWRRGVRACRDPQRCFAYKNGRDGRHLYWLGGMVQSD